MGMRGEKRKKTAQKAGKKKKGMGMRGEKSRRTALKAGKKQDQMGIGEGIFVKIPG